MKSSAKPPKPLKDSELGGVPAGSALIVVNVKGDAEISVAFERVSANPAEPAWTDGRPAEIVATRPARTYAKSLAGAGSTLVFAVPPGRWRLEGVSVNWIPLSFCLGSPAFDVAAGEAVYAGAYEPDEIVPDMAIEPAKAAFPGLSTVPDKLKPAAWMNGAQGQCQGTYLYAIELPGTPYLDGYVLGTRAQPAPSPAPAPTANAASAPMPATPSQIRQAG